MLSLRGNMKSKSLWGPLVGLIITVVGLVPVWQQCSDWCTDGSIQVGFISVGVSILGYSLIQRSALAPELKTGTHFLASAVFVPAMLIFIPGSINGWLIMITLVPAGICGITLTIIGLVKFAKAWK